VANYYVASGFGFWFASTGEYAGISGQEPWLWIAATVGVLFISLFYLMALTSQMHGVSVTSIDTKMSMLIPAVFFVLIDPSEGLGVMKIIGVALGVIAVVLASTKKTEGAAKTAAWLIPIVLFVGSGFLDVLLAFAEKTHLPTDAAYRGFVPVPFGFAALIGTAIVLFRILTKKEVFSLKSWGAGIILGLVNYGSIYFLLRILGTGILDRSSTIPANNMGVVALSALVGFVFFKERLSPKNIWGIVLAIAAILILSWGVF
jgi:drug/metabolite transporter (DMT)-like permease